MPDGKIISFNNRLYYNNNQPIGQSTINIYTVMLNNIEIVGDNTTYTTLPIQSIQNRFVECWSISSASRERIPYIQICNSNKDRYFQTDSIYLSPYITYVWFFNNYSAQIYQNIYTYPITSTILAVNGSFNYSQYYNIKYSCAYFA